jgi:hypothetical protein
MIQNGENTLGWTFKASSEITTFSESLLNLACRDPVHNRGSGAHSPYIL